jgi:tetratricopeptide (TPR) repeat protein
LVAPSVEKEIPVQSKYYLAVFSLIIFLAGCGGTFQTAGLIASGRQAVFTGNYQAALGFFQEAAQANPNAVFGATLRMGVFSYLGQAQYLTGNYAQALETLEKALDEHPADNVARLYLGLAQARLGNRQEGLKNIEAGMSGIASFLNYLETNFAYSFGQFWDPGGQIRASIKTDLAMISSGDIDWPQLIADGERLGIRIQEEEDRARRQQQQQRPFPLR